MGLYERLSQSSKCHKVECSSDRITISPIDESEESLREFATIADEVYACAVGQENGPFWVLPKTGLAPVSWRGEVLGLRGFR